MLSASLSENGKRPPDARKRYHVAHSNRMYCHVAASRGPIWAH